MSNIEAIIVDGVRYDKVKAKTEFVCEECELREECENVSYVQFAEKCNVIISNNECWKRKE
jgi:hypothetical protein